MNEKTDIKMEAYDMRERYTSTKTLLGMYKFTILVQMEYFSCSFTWILCEDVRKA